MNPQQYTVTPVARIHTDYQSKFGIPRQSGMTDSKGIIVFEPGFRNPDAVRGIEEFSHLWLLWVFSENVDKEFTPTVRPPRLGGNERRGVFATRAPFRPNHMGLSCLKIESIDVQAKGGPVIHVSGADMADKTPVYDIKPYIPYADCIQGAKGGFADGAPGTIQVEFGCHVPDMVTEEMTQCIRQILAQDPRPSYKDDAERIYGMSYGGLDIRFKGTKQKITVVDISEETR